VTLRRETEIEGKSRQRNFVVSEDHHRRRLTNRPRLSPSEHRNFFAQWLGERPAREVISSR
jgi:hypothetical protein